MQRTDCFTRWQQRLDPLGISMITHKLQTIFTSLLEDLECPCRQKLIEHSGRSIVDTHLLIYFCRDVKIAREVTIFETTRCINYTWNAWIKIKQRIKTEKDDTTRYKRFIFIGFEVLTSNANLVIILCCLGCFQISVHFGAPVEYLVTRLLFSKQLSPHYRTHKLENRPLPVTRNWLFNIFAANMNICRCFLHPQPENEHVLVTSKPVSCFQGETFLAKYIIRSEEKRFLYWRIKWQHFICILAANFHKKTPSNLETKSMGCLPNSMIKSASRRLVSIN
jgi:hypothetical protein